MIEPKGKFYVLKHSRKSERLSKKLCNSFVIEKDKNKQRRKGPPMETGPTGGALGGDDLSPSSPAAVISRWTFEVSRRYQHLLDKTVPHVLNRWIGCLAVVLIYAVRVYFVQGFYIVTYGLGIYLLNLLMGFLSPQVDPEMEDGPSLPVSGSDEFRPFVRRLPEFKFWYSITKAFCIAFVMTFFSVFDVPVFWPILLFYWIMLFILTMRKQILHMIKYKYVPFSFGKQRYDSKKASPTENTNLPRD
ncbi:hypothetical protein GOBAR_AA12276 [Gossypium barbadense]|uniref:Protein RER1 n=9 Tax=Gossypium TaxID=3633 RepID=A0A2P5XYH2_GOSBA|nr:hypothetical protein GOBAR_AA12276 [Gossypium barbadense]